MATLIDSNTG